MKQAVGCGMGGLDTKGLLVVLRALKDHDFQVGNDDQLGCM